MDDKESSKSASYHPALAIVCFLRLGGFGGQSTLLMTTTHRASSQAAFLALTTACFAHEWYCRDMSVSSSDVATDPLESLWTPKTLLSELYFLVL